MNRREFLKGSAWMGATAFAAGCHLNRLGFGEGGQMQDFVYTKLRGKRIRVGFVGIGSRGTGAVNRVSMLPGVDVVALCDKDPARVELNLKNLRDKKYPLVDQIKTYTGNDGYKELCDFGDCDIVYCATPWALHQPVALRALQGDKLPLVEVTSALTVDECWELVEESEKRRIPCMQLENCLYGEMELLGLHLAKTGVLGELVHAEGAYIHDLRAVVPTKSSHRESAWRYKENFDHKGNRYPTHGLVPLMAALDINRGDRFDYLVSLECDQHQYEWFKQSLPDDDPRKKDPPAAMGDMNTTLIKTVKGRSIMVQHDVSSPRPYTRLNLLSGTKGIWWGMPWRVYDGNDVFKVGIEKEIGKGVHQFMADEEAQKFRKEHTHPLWAAVGEIAKKVGGHGGMDFIMDLRWAYCLQNGLPLDMDVYDLAASSCLCELTEKSVRNRSQAIDIPDFTRGNWKLAKPQGIFTVDVSKIKFDKVGKDPNALNV